MIVPLARLQRSAVSRGLSLARWLLVPWVVAQMIRTVWRARRALRQAHAIVAYQGGGFGHHVAGPDIIRRLFPDQRVVVLLAVYPGEHNMHLPLMWAAPEIFLVPCGLRQGPGQSFRIPIHVQWWLFRQLARCLRLLYPRAQVVRSLSEVQRLLWETVLAMGASDTGDFEEFRRTDEQTWILAWFELIRRRPQPPARLPLAASADIVSRLDRAAAPSGRPIKGCCCIYLRERGNEAELETSSRSGSPVDDYLAAVEHLVRRGYQCLLIGDRVLPPTLASRFPGWFVDAGSIGADAELFSLYAGTRADLFICESGGGSLMATVADIPCLSLNHFPFYVARFQATVFPKFCDDHAGRPMPVERLFGDLAQAFATPEGRFRNGRPDELLAAVKEFVDAYEQGNLPYGVTVEHIVGPNKWWYAVAQARISPTWLRLAGWQPLADAAKVASGTATS